MYETDDESDSHSTISEVMTFDDISVELCEERKVDDFIVRELKIIKVRIS